MRTSIGRSPLEHRLRPLRALVLLSLLALVPAPVGARADEAFGHRAGLDATASPRVYGRVHAQGPGAAATVGDASTGLGLHIIEPGDTLFSLAQRYGTRVDVLANQNVMSSGAILIPGRVLRVPLAVPAGREGLLESASTVTGNGPSRVDLGSRPISSTSATGAGVAGEHHVMPGETLFGIAGRYGVSVHDLQRWNGLDDSGDVQAGATLSLGPRSDASDIAPGASEAPVPAALDAVGRTEAPARPASDGSTDFVHVVQAGETLSAIARAYGETPISLERLNGLASDTIFVGQEIRIPAMGLGPAAAPPFGEKRVEVDISEQRLYAWQGDTLIWNMVASSGMAGFTTRRGTFAIQSKIPNAWSSPWQLWMPYWMGIYWAGGSENGIHALPINNGQRLWAGYLGSPISYGCIVLSTEDAMRLYNWVEMGTEVVIRD